MRMFPKRKKPSPKKATAAQEPSLGPETDTATDQEAGVSSATQTPKAEKPAAARGKSKKTTKGAEVVDASHVENPRVIIAEAVGQQAVTLAKVNTGLKIAVVALGVVSVASIMLAASVWHKETQYRYFFMDTNGTILENQPLTEPALSLNMVRDFYAESFSHLFSFDYRNFGMHYQRLAPDIMTESAMIDFSREIDRIGLVQGMEKRREVAEAVITRTPVLNSSGVDPKTGVYTWELSVPFNLRLESGLSERNNIRRMRGVARVQVIRVAPTVHPRRILINRITIRDTTND